MNSAFAGYRRTDPMSKIERIKAATDGLDVLPELLRAAREGWETLDPDHVGLLKWYGLYAHNTGDGHFMMRVKVIQGKLSAAQAETMASIAEDFGRGVIDCTTRQCFQIHWITLDNIPEIFRRLERGRPDDLRRVRRHHAQRGRLHRLRPGARRDRRRLRHVRGDPRVLPGQQALLEPPAQVQGVRHRLRGGLRARPDQRHRALGGDPRRTARSGFNLRVGGGLSTQPRFARWVDIFVTPEEAPEVVAAVTGIFRDSEENRKARGKARLKFLVDRIGPEALREEIDRARRPRRCATASRRPRACPARTTSASSRRPTARHSTVGLVVPVGRLKASQLFELVAARAQVRLPRGRRAAPHAPAERRCCRGSRRRTSTRCSPSR